MGSELKTLLSQIDDALACYEAGRAKAKFDDLTDLGEAATTEIAGRLTGVIERLAPAGSNYRRDVEARIKRWGVGWQVVEPAVGILRALRYDYEHGYFCAVEELVHSDTFSGFLEMAAHLQSKGYKDAAAVIAGSVLEQHLRALCHKHEIEVMSGESCKKAETLNTELAAKSVYSKLDQKHVTSWLGLRNDAAHGNYDSYSQQQVRLLIDSIGDFLSRYPA